MYSDCTLREHEQNFREADIWFLPGYVRVSKVFISSLSLPLSLSLSLSRHIYIPARFFTEKVNPEFGGKYNLFDNRGRKQYKSFDGKILSVWSTSQGLFFSFLFVPLSIHFSVEIMNGLCVCVCVCV